MKKILIGFAVFLLILLISAWLAPIIYSCAHFKFHRILSRCVMIITVLATAVFVSKTLNKQRLFSLISDYGLTWQRRWSLRSMITGFVCSCVVLLAVVLSELAMGVRFLDVQVSYSFIIKVISVLCAAFLIAFIEEWFFRGVVFKKLLPLSVPAAFIVTNVFYAILHFLKAQGVALEHAPTIVDSFRVYGALLAPLSDPTKILPNFIGLFLFGIVLTYACWKTKSLYHSIGIHAGCIFFLKIYGAFFHFNEQASTFLYGSKNIYDGVAGWVGLLVIGFLVAFVLRFKKSISHNAL
jgi:uncharacterized protein